MDTATIHMLFEYTRWAHRRVWSCAEQLSDEDYQRDMGYSWGSVHSQLVHIMAAEWLWLRRLHGESPTSLPGAVEYPTRAALRQQWDALEGDMRTYLASLTDADLAAEFDSKSTRGQARRSNVGAILLHVFNHGTDHRAQALAMIDRLGGETVGQDLLTYLVEQGK